MYNEVKKSENQTEYINTLESQVKMLENKIAWLMEQITLSKHKKFGASSEKSQYDQFSLFDEVETEADVSVKEPELEEINYKRKKRVGKKAEMLEDLEVEVVEYYLPEHEQSCPECSNALHIMGKNIRKELKIIPAQARVVEHVQYIYACRHCETHSDVTPIIKAEVPQPVIKGSIASPSTVAYIMSQKYVNAMPLYRQEKEFERLGIGISRQTMANWVIKCSNDWLEPLYSAMKKLLIKRDVIHADETVLQVLKEPGKKAQSNSYMWLYRTSGDTDSAIVLYEYQPDRTAKRAKQFLEGFQGYLHVDGYAAYHNLSDDITVCGCWSHARRKFDEALKSIKPSECIGSQSLQGKTYCDKLFAIEKSLDKCTIEERYIKRQELSKPILKDFLAWLKTSDALPKTALGKAIHYALSQWKYLENYLLDGRCEISNNRAERSIKPFVIGRKNFLFSDTVRGAKASATIYSVVETAKENGLNPMKYLTFLFEKIPNMDFKNNPNLFESVFPWGDLPAECYLNKKD